LLQELEEIQYKFLYGKKGGGNVEIFGFGSALST